MFQDKECDMMFLSTFLSPSTGSKDAQNDVRPLPIRGVPDRDSQPVVIGLRRDFSTILL